MTLALILICIFASITILGVFVWNYSIAPTLNLNEMSIYQGIAISLFFTALNLPEIIEAIKNYT